MDANFTQQMREGSWALICRGTETHLEQMSTHWCQETYELVAAKRRLFVSRPPPNDEEELHQRFMQNSGLTSIIGLVAHVEHMGKRYPRRKEDRLRLVKAACSLELPKNGKESSELHTAVAVISMQVASLGYAS